MRLCPEYFTEGVEGLRAATTAAGTSNGGQHPHLSTARTHFHFLPARDTVDQVSSNWI